MKFIVGLGNPGTKYQLTRHNIGFWVIDQLSEKWGIPVTKEKWKSLVGEGTVHGEKVILMKPLTFMNLSGEAVRPALDYLKGNIEDLVVIYDDLDLPLGQIRLRLKGSAGGHNGMKSIISHIGTQEFKRIKIGIDRPPVKISVPDYVLSPFSKEELSLAQEAAQISANAVDVWIYSNFLEAMNRFNVKK
ncbi:aminoacyl-tRNA hydrolase [Thermoflavimicrobium daqui]|jgi:PTH1 family peptidyl-tRNA hydrolase|uniref:Peptidyl-tRNA hydrolase n=1 Tax=Thermoflavimicrobium daqui TaxID=2137476 RepID=A0A364K373_9BACL|nr:aminoacyl-tRNA hydrolase [Thermoflavimicrobium daqui]RAL23176.1 aminoacyl-tRNA hydrolase [Thermoflavimicrobium daqui]